MFYNITKLNVFLWKCKFSRGGKSRMCCITYSIPI